MLFRSFLVADSCSGLGRVLKIINPKLGIAGCGDSSRYQQCAASFLLTSYCGLFQPKLWNNTWKGNTIYPPCDNNFLLWNRARLMYHWSFPYVY